MEKHYGERGVELNEARLRMAALPTPADDVLFTPGLWVGTNGCEPTALCTHGCAACSSAARRPQPPPPQPPISAPQLRFEACTLIMHAATHTTQVPLAVLERVYILPGIPRLFQSMVSAHKVGLAANKYRYITRATLLNLRIYLQCAPAESRLRGIACRTHLPVTPLAFPQDRFRGPQALTSLLYTLAGEGDVAEPLARVAAAHPAVQIGACVATFRGCVFVWQLRVAQLVYATRPCAPAPLLRSCSGANVRMPPATPAGSYPNTSAAAEAPGGADYKVKLSLTSRDAGALAAAVEAARAAVPGCFE